MDEASFSCENSEKTSEKEGEKRHLEEEEVCTSQVFTLSFQLKMNVDPTPPSLYFSCRVSIHSTSWFRRLS